MFGHRYDGKRNITKTKKYNKNKIRSIVKVFVIC